MGGWEVWIVTSTRIAHRGMLSDFSLGGRGLLIRCPVLGTQSGSPSPDDEEEQIAIGITIPLGKTERTFRQYGRIVRRYPEGIAVELIRPNVKLLSGLQALAVRLGRNRESARVQGTAASLFNEAS